jgi:hypothetical protein
MNVIEKKTIYFLISSFRRVLNVACNFWVVPRRQAELGTSTKQLLAPAVLTEY